MLATRNVYLERRRDRSRVTASGTRDLGRMKKKARQAARRDFGSVQIICSTRFVDRCPRFSLRSPHNNAWYEKEDYSENCKSETYRRFFSACLGYQTNPNPNPERRLLLNESVSESRRSNRGTRKNSLDTRLITPFHSETIVKLIIFLQ